MKKIYTLLLLFIGFLGYSQFNENAPWNEGVNKSELKDFDKEVIRFDNYWQTHDPNVKGSGHKPFMRWKTHYENARNTNGTILSAQQIWKAWQNEEAKKYGSQLRNANTTLVAPISNWRPVGPFTHTATGTWSRGQGRVNIIEEAPNNPNIIYVGTPAGGIWKSTNGGTTWDNLSDNLPQIGVSGIAIDHQNPNIIYITTGDKDAGDTYSVGVLKSIDGGLTWNTTGLVLGNESDLAGDIKMHPTNNQILICATNNGLYKTTNGGTTWTQQLAAENFSSGSIRFKPGNPSVIFASSKNKFYRSTNTGNSFTNIASGFPSSNLTGRMLLDVTPANSEYVYVLTSTTGSAFQGVYRSTNGGTTFIKTSNTTNVFESTQAYYDLGFAVSATNAEEVYTGCLNVWKSVNGGNDFSKVNFWNNFSQPTYTHADIHYLGFFGNNLYCGSDGGIFKSTDNADSFTDLTAGLQISQFYRVAVSKQSSTKMVGGLQDNGGYAYSEGAWKNYHGADGMDAAVSLTDQNKYYGFIQYGGSMYVSGNAGNSYSSSVTKPVANGNWITPLKSNAAGEIFSGFTKLYRLQGAAWVAQSNTTFNIGTANIDYIEIDPSNDNNMYVVYDTNLYKSTDKGINLSLVYSAMSNITSVEVHSTNSNIIYITTSGNDGDVLKSTDGGVSFNQVAQGLPTIPKHIVVHQSRNTNNPIYVGTELGVYYFDDTLTQWELFDTNLPNVPVRDLEINIEDAKIIAATYGRGIWQADIPVQVPPTDVKFVAAVNPTSNINCNGNISPQINIKNGGTNSIASVTVNYTVDGVAQTAVNFTGNIAAGETQLVNLNALTVSKGTHSMTFSVTTPNDAYADNNAGNTIFYVNNSGAVGTNNPFTTATNDLIVITDQGGAWTRGVRTGTTTLGNTGNPAYVTNLTGKYTDNTKTFLVSQCYNLANVTNPQISFKMKFDLEQDYDICYVQYSTNFGASWQVLGTLGATWYNSDITQANSSCENCVGAQWTGNNTVNTTYSYSLTSLNRPTNVIFRIVFHSDGGTVNEGANIDDFIISGVLSANSFDFDQVAIYPNPSTNIFNVNLGNIEANAFEVYDITGKIITKNDNLVTNDNLFTIDLTNTANGVYFVKIKTAETSFVKRIIKQ